MAQGSNVYAMQPFQGLYILEDDYEESFTTLEDLFAPGDDGDDNQVFDVTRALGGAEEGRLCGPCPDAPTCSCDVACDCLLT